MRDANEAGADGAGVDVADTVDEDAYGRDSVSDVDMGPYCPAGSFEDVPECRELFTTSQDFRRTWEFGERRIAETADFELGFTEAIPEGTDRGQVVDKDSSKITISPEGNGDNLEFHLAPDADAAYSAISTGDLVNVDKLGPWSLLEGPDYRIGAREIRAQDWREACLSTPDGFVQARLYPSCTDTVEADFDCPQSKKPVQVFGLQLKEGAETAKGEYTEAVEVGDWTGQLNLGVRLRPGSTPFCEREGVYAALMLVGPASN